MIIVTDNESSGERLYVLCCVVAIYPVLEICKLCVGSGGSQRSLGIHGAWIYSKKCQNMFTCLQISCYIMEVMLLLRQIQPKTSTGSHGGKDSNNLIAVMFWYLHHPQSS